MSTKKKNEKVFPWTFVFFIIIFMFLAFGSHDSDTVDNEGRKEYSSNVFSLISSSENKVFEEQIKSFAKKNKIDIDISYDDTLKITRRLNQGEILVAEFTDPGWIMLFPAASGILVERGSLLSHSAIVSRELGIPAVVGITGLMDTLNDGDIVELNGTTGEIRKI